MGSSLPFLEAERHVRQKWLNEAAEQYPPPTLRDFIKQSWQVIEPGKDLLWNWHIDCLSEYLEAVTLGEIQHLLVNLPPRNMKSICITVDWPTWVWLRKPELSWIFFSYADALATKHSLDRRRIIQSDWYQSRWGHVYQMTSDQNVKTEYENNRRGVMLATGLSGGAHGKGGDILVFDDPHNPNDVASEAKRASDIAAFSQASTRLNNKRTGAIVVVMQRVHEDDIAERCIEQGYTHLCLPARAEERTTISVPSGKVYTREEGDLLWPEREGTEELANAKRALGSYAYAAQYQQRPAPSEGGLLKRHWWRFWYPADMQGNPPPPVLVRLEDGTYHECPQAPLPESFEQQLQSWDTTFKDTSTSDYVAGGVWGRTDADTYLLDQIREKMDVVAAMHALEAMCIKWPEARLKLIEDKANGSAIISMARGRIGGIVGVNPDGGKVSRANAVAPSIESGNVYLPHPRLPGMGWVHDFIEEAAVFPNGKHDDQVDQMTQALNRLSKRGGRAA